MSGNRCVHSQIQSYECYVELPDGIRVDAADATGWRS